MYNTFESAYFAAVRARQPQIAMIKCGGDDFRTWFLVFDDGTARMIDKRV